MSSFIDISPVLNWFELIGEDFSAGLQILQGIADYFSAIFASLFASFRFMLQSLGFVVNLQVFLPPVIYISCTVVLVVAILRTIFAR